MTDQLRCAHCGDVIGIYEPLFVTDGSSIRETSRAADPDLSPSRGVHVHGACYAAWRDAASDAR